MDIPRTIREVHNALVHKKISAVELANECLKRIKMCDGNIHSFLSIDEDAARRVAVRIDERLAGGEEIGILEGIPLAIKDNMVMKDTVTTAGSKMLEQYRAPYTATVVEKLQAAGAMILGKTNMDEFAMGSSTENSAFGPTKNPWDMTRVPGGSSGGSAAAVAANFCVASLGSDTGGSIRQPAGFCGVVGLKPTYGSVSRSGLIAMASSLDQIGPFAKTVEDTAILFDAIKGPDPLDASSKNAPTASITAEINQPIRGMRIGVPKEYFADGMDSEVEAAIRVSLEEFKKQGAEIVEVSLPHTQYALAVYYIVMPAEVSANLARFDGIRYGHSTKDAQNLLETYMRSREEGFGAEVRRRIMLGTYVLAAGYYDAYYKQAQRVRELVKRDFNDAFRLCDILATPTSPILPFVFGEKVDDPLAMYLADIFTVSANIAGIPGLSLPCGFAERDGKKLPIGLQLLGKHFDEQSMLRAGHAYEQATEWHTITPSLT